MKLLSPMEYSVRPTTDKIKESILIFLFEVGESSVVLVYFVVVGDWYRVQSKGAEKFILVIF